MGADIDEGPQHAIGMADDQDGYAGIVKGEVIARIGDHATGADELGIVAKQLGLFPLELLGVVILPDIDLHHAVGEGGGIAIHQVHQCLELFDLLLPLHGLSSWVM